MAQVTAQPQDAQLHLALARVAAALGERPGKKPEDYVARGTSKFWRQDWAGAIADYSTAIKLKPDDLLAYLNRGQAYTAQQYYAHALADFDQVIKLNPGWWPGYYNRGLVYALRLNAGDRDRAIADFRKVIELTPDTTGRNEALQRLKELGVTP
jgi:tetratricopeptide (TPR) repeat protein